MRPMINDTLIILSACLSGSSPRENLDRSEELREMLKVRGFPFGEATGSWRGVEESSFIVRTNNKVDKLMLLKWAREFKQEAVLEIMPDRSCRLLDVNWPASGHPVYMGYIQNIPSRRIHEFEAWTRLESGPYVGQYYVADKRRLA